MSQEQILSAFITWLTSRPERSGPFGQNWGPQEGFALVAEYLALQNVSADLAKDATPAPETAPVDSTSN